MKEISRAEFLKTSSLVFVAAMNPPILFSKSSKVSDIDEVMLKRLVEANDITVKQLLPIILSNQQRQHFRSLGEAFSIFAAAYYHPSSSYNGSDDLQTAMNLIIDKLISFQYPNGTLDSGGNRKSPPDTSFLLDTLFPAAIILRQTDVAALDSIKNKLDEFLLAAGEGIKKGGVHTPNHRWEISSALAKLYKLYGDKTYVDRIDEWLAEGIYQNSDGNYPERSRNYAVVENQAFLTIGEMLNRPEMFNIVSKNLESTFYYTELNGDMVCLDSRRQDQWRPITIFNNYATYRYMANRDKNKFFAAIVREIEGLEDFEMNILRRFLPRFLSSEILQMKLPESETLPANYTKHFKESDLARIKRGNMTASVFAGNDLPLTVASGRSCNPTFFSFRKGSAILEYARLSTSFFSMGYVRGDGLQKHGDRYTFHERKEAYYYHPFSKDKRDENGDYKLTESLDGRFWSKMDFGEREKTTLTQETKIVIEEKDGAFRIDIEMDGPENVEVTLDLCFRDGGKFEGVMGDENGKNFFLDSGSAKYKVGNDTIEVGPGKYEHENLRGLDGEVYSTHFGSIRGDGQHLYITGFLPFKHSLTIG